jgi:hypothetical protein
MGYFKSVRQFAPLLLPIVALMAGAIQVASQGLITPPASPAQESGQQSTFTDPFAYCAAVGTVDAPDSRYTGPKVPEAVARGLKRAFGAPAHAPLESFLRNTFWRCMDGRVYACTVGANLPCHERADTSRKPGQGVIDFCKNNPQAEVIPAVVTGRTTVYEWKCTNAVPEVVRQFAHPDARGFLSNIWYAINPDL